MKNPEKLSVFIDLISYPRFIGRSYEWDDQEYSHLSLAKLYNLVYHILQVEKALLAQSESDLEM